jgi:hypothetical protein
MKMRRFSLFWIAVCLSSLLAAQTNALLAIHIADCCEHNCGGENPSRTPAEHQKQCHYCQFFLHLANTTIAEVPAFTLHAEPDTYEETILLRSCTLQTDIPCHPGRGPPCA